MNSLQKEKIVTMENIAIQAHDAQKLHIGDKVICWRSGQLIGQDKTVKLEPRTLAFLYYLCQYPQQLISREQLLASVWEDRFVSDDAIRGVVKKLREALGDNAKSPTYIKTVPLKGYMLIASISSVDDNLSKTDAAIGPWKNKLAIAILFSMVIFVIFLWLNLSNNTDFIDNASPTIEIEKLTKLSGTESDGSFSELLQTLIFSHAKARQDAHALYRKHLPSGKVERLTFEDGGHYHARFSPDSSLVSYIRETRDGLENVIANYSADGLTHETVIVDNGSKKEVLSWSADGQSLYFRSSQFERDQQESTAIYRYVLSNRDWQQVTFPHVKGSGDQLAEESFDGRYLAIIRNTSDRRFSLLILDLLNKQIKIEQPLPFIAKNLMWLGKKNTRLVISSFKGQLYYFDTVSNKLEQEIGLPLQLSDVFYDCGERCLFMRQAKLNVFDIIEIPNPFNKKGKLASTYYESDHSELYPVYNKTGDSVYFIRMNKNGVHMMRHTPEKKGEKLFSVGTTKNISQLSIHPNEEYIAGKIEGRAFIYNLQNQQLLFLTSQDEFVSVSGWSRDGQFLYLSRLEQATSVLLKYDVNTKKIIDLHSQGKGYYQLPDGRDFIIDHEHNLLQILSENKRKFIINLPMCGIGNWQVHNEFLYFVEIKGPTIFINKLNLVSGKKTREVLFENEWVATFSLHPQGHKMLITKSLSDDGDLVKVKLKNK
jgi:DNA-binding winged helix-turn-helix (wHTH) protein/Tol biopolymer transport system component